MSKPKARKNKPAKPKIEMGFHHFLRPGAGFHESKKYNRKVKHKNKKDW